MLHCAVQYRPKLVKSVDDYSCWTTLLVYAEWRLQKFPKSLIDPISLFVGEHKKCIPGTTYFLIELDLKAESQHCTIPYISTKRFLEVSK